MTQSTSDRAADMVQSLGVQVRGMGLGGGVELPDMALLAIDPDMRRPALAVSAARNTHETVDVVAPSHPLVLQIYAGRNIAQVCYGVVAAVAVNVVDFASGPFASCVQPSQAVGVIPPAKNDETDVAVAVLVARYIANLDTIGRPHKPRKHARLRVISQDAAQVVGAKIVASHIGLRKRLIGQRLGRIGSARRASLFYQLGESA